MANAIERPIEKCLWQLDDGRWCYGETQRPSDLDAPFAVVRVYPYQLPAYVRERANDYYRQQTGETAWWFMLRLPRERVVIIDATEVV